MSNYIHPTAIVDPSVILGDNNHIGAFCYITGDTTIGNNNRFEAYCSIGTPPEHKHYYGKETKGVVIGNNNVFREFITINSGCTQDTTIENNVWILKGAYVGHDTLIENDALLSSGVLLGGYCIVGRNSNLGLGAICHQGTIIGGGAMIGMGAIITKKKAVLPLSVYVGNPAKFLKLNTYKLNILSEEEVEEYNNSYNNHIKSKQ
jgi:UDP-N-acetylglucosamine acyltransferase